jgi:hypothetical protein
MPNSLLPLVVCWLSLYGIIRSLFHALCKREAFLLAWLGWGTILVIITEGLSLFHQLASGPLLAAWLAVTALAVVGFFYIWYRQIGITKTLSALKSIHFPSIQMHWVEWVMICIITGQVVTLFMAALVYPPTNVDSMTYHLARVMHWQQDRSVAFYATDVERQIQMPPFTEYVFAQFHILVKNDVFDNLVQWFAMLISLLGVSAIAKKLGSNHFQQIAAALLCVSIPMGILQASGTQNDYMVSALLVCLTYFGLNLIEQPGSWLWSAGVGLSLGLAVLTKSTAFVFALPVCLWLGTEIILKKHWRALLYSGVMILFFATLNAGQFVRNVTLYGSITGPQEGYRNELMTPAGVASNIIRNTAGQLTIKSDIPLIDQAGEDVMAWLRLLHQLTGLQTNDPRNSYNEDNVFLSQGNTNEYISGSPLHAWLIIIAVFIVLFRGQWKETTFKYCLALIGGFIFFSFYLKWQIWGTRLELPLLVLWCAVLPLILFHQPKSWLALIPIIIGLYGFHWTFGNQFRPITPTANYTASRDNLMFTENPELQKRFADMADFTIASGCQQVGLNLKTTNTWEYPLWVLLQERGFKGRIEYVQVDNPSKVYTDPKFKPCTVFSFGIDQLYEGKWRRIDLAGYYLYLELAPGS